MTGTRFAVVVAAGAAFVAQTIPAEAAVPGCKSPQLKAELRHIAARSGYEILDFQRISEHPNSTPDDQRCIAVLTTSHADDQPVGIRVWRGTEGQTLVKMVPLNPLEAAMANDDINAAKKATTGRPKP